MRVGIQSIVNYLNITIENRLVRIFKRQAVQILDIQFCGIKLPIFSTLRSYFQNNNAILLGYVLFCCQYNYGLKSYYIFSASLYVDLVSPLCAMHQTIYDNFVSVYRGYVYFISVVFRNYVSSTFLSLPKWRINVSVVRKHS